jgi:aspartyl protease family protein
MTRELPRTVKVTTVWLLLGLAVFLGVQWWQAREHQTRFFAEGGVIEIRRSPDGHYHWPGRVNGRDVDFLVDTGATGTAISAALARDLGLESLGPVQSNTAAGVTTGELVRADVVLDGGVQVRALRVVALPGLGAHPLLGMDVLARLRWQQAEGRLRIELPGRDGRAGSP